MIAVLDARSGNVDSVINVLRSLPYAVSIARRGADLSAAHTIILPGVGSAGAYMKRLKRNDLLPATVDAYANGVRLVGICLGLQVLFDGSEEDGGVECLGFLNGGVTKLAAHAGRSHTGWAPFNFERKYLFDSDHNAVYAATRSRTVRGRVYYNHEYGVPVIQKDRVAGAVAINNPSFELFASMVITEQIIGMQFHPEKSQQTGLRLLSMVL